jgi:hypothetical protein
MNGSGPHEDALMFDFARCDAIDGWMLEEELRWLHDQAARCAAVLEVGCWKGRSAMALAQGCPGRVYTVDHFRGSPSEAEGHREATVLDLATVARENLRGMPHVTVLPLASANAAALFEPRSLDLVFIDGEHTAPAVEADLRAWAPKAARVLCGHDRRLASVQAGLAACGIAWELGPGSLWVAEVAA